MLYMGMAICCMAVRMHDFRLNGMDTVDAECVYEEQVGMQNASASDG